MAAPRVRGGAAIKHLARICLVFMMGLFLEPRCLPGSTKHPPEQEQLRLGVRFYNYARISDFELRAAEKVVAQLLSEAKIQLAWTGCITNHRTSDGVPSPCDASTRPTDLVLYFVGPLEEHFKSVDYSALGYSIIPDGYELATMAYVSYPRVQRLSEYTSVDMAELLGLAVAHEIGHLLFGSPDHANQGIMRTPWLLRDLENRGWELHFTRDQSQRLRAAAQARLRAKDPNSVRSKETDISPESR